MCVSWESNLLFLYNSFFKHKKLDNHNRLILVIQPNHEGQTEQPAGTVQPSGADGV